MLSKILIVIILTLASNLYAAAMYGISGKLIGFGPKQKTSKYFVDIERPNGTRYRIIVDENTLNSVKSKSSEVYITAIDSDIYSNFGSGLNFTQLNNGAPF